MGKNAQLGEIQPDTGGEGHFSQSLERECPGWVHITLRALHLEQLSANLKTISHLSLENKQAQKTEATGYWCLMRK